MSDEFIKAERDYELRMAEFHRDERRRQRLAWNERITAIATAVAVSVIAIVVGLVAWRWVADTAAENTKRDEACYAAGGTRTTIGGGSTVCVRVGGEVAPK